MFIIGGVGRSGTHLLAKYLASHPDLTVDIEAEPQFSYSVKYLVYKYQYHYNSLIDIYKSKNHPHYVTKDHTNIWLYDQLKKEFSDIKFIVIERDLKQVIASSLKHVGVMKWVTQNYPKNPLSGTTSPFWTPESTPLEKLIYRWHEHHLQIERIKHNPDVFYLTYDDLLDHDLSESLADFMNVENKFVKPKIVETRKKWTELSHDILKVLDDFI